MLRETTKSAPLRQLLPPVQAAAHAGVSRQTIHQWLQDGLIEGDRMGRWWLVSLTSLESYLRVRAQAPSTGGMTNAEANRNRKRARAQAATEEAALV